MNPEHLIAELVNKLHSGAIDPHGPNTEADVRGIVMKHWEAGKKPKAIRICDQILLPSGELEDVWRDSLQDERRP